METAENTPKFERPPGRRTLPPGHKRETIAATIPADFLRIFEAEAERRYTTRAQLAGALILDFINGLNRPDTDRAVHASEAAP